VTATPSATAEPTGSACGHSTGAGRRRPRTRTRRTRRSPQPAAGVWASGPTVVGAAAVSEPCDAGAAADLAARLCSAGAPRPETRTPAVGRRRSARGRVVAAEGRSRGQPARARGRGRNQPAAPFNSSRSCGCPPEPPAPTAITTATVAASAARETRRRPATRRARLRPERRAGPTFPPPAGARASPGRTHRARDETSAPGRPSSSAPNAGRITGRSAATSSATHPRSSA